MFRLCVNDFDPHRKDKLLDDIGKLQTSLDSEQQLSRQFTHMKGSLKDSICSLKKHINQQQADLHLVALHAAKVLDVRAQAEQEAAQARGQLETLTKTVETRQRKRQQDIHRKELQEERLKAGVARLSQAATQTAFQQQQSERARSTALDLLKEALAQHADHKLTQEQSAAYVRQCESELTALKQY